jgi:hypothetical protein
MCLRADLLQGLLLGLIWPDEQNKPTKNKR